MKSLLTSTLVFLATGTWLQAQQAEWTMQLQSGGPEIGHCIAADQDGNVYTTGYFHGKVDFDPGPAKAVLTSNSSADIFIQKLDANGNFLWVKQMGGNKHEEVHAMAVDNTGAVYITGYFRGSPDFDPGPGEEHLSSHDDWFDIFVLKLNAQGKLCWAKDMGGADMDRGNDIAVDNLGNVYITGMFEGEADINPGSGTAHLVSYGQADIFLIKLDTAGHFQWARHAGGKFNDEGESVATDAQGNIYLTGTFTGKVDFDHSHHGTDELHATGDVDLFVQKLDPQGNHLWLEHIERNGEDLQYHLEVSPVGDVFLTGSFHGQLDFDPNAAHTANLHSAGGEDIFIKKLNTNGEFLWAKQVGGAGNDMANDIVLDSEGSLYILGTFEGEVDFDPAKDSRTIATALSEQDLFIQKLNSNGELQWMQHLENEGEDLAYGLAVDARLDLFTTGSLEAEPTRMSQILGEKIHSAFISKIAQHGKTIALK